MTLAGWRFGGGTVTEPGDPESVTGREISSDLLPVLGITPCSAGRSFRRRTAPARRPWPSSVMRFGSVGSAQSGGHGHAAGPRGRNLHRRRRPSRELPAARKRLRPVHSARSGHRPLHAEPGSSRRPGAGAHPSRRKLAEAQAELALIGRRLAEQYPKSNKGRIFIADRLRPPVDDVRGTLWLLLGAVSLVLLIACVNIASLILARAVSRERELAMRVALGAGRGRLVRQCLTESSVLAVSGGAMGIALAAIGLRPFVAYWPGSLPRAEEVGLDWRVLLFALGISLASGILFGLAPALRVPARSLDRTLRAGARSIAGASRRLHGGFVVSEIALAVVLLISAGMLGRTLLRLSSLDAGVNIRNVLTARMSLSPATLADPGKTRAAWNDVLDRARRVPGVQAVAMVDTVPMREGSNPIGYRTTPAEVPDNQQPLALANSVTPDYLEVMGIALRQGRFLTDQDRMGAEPVAVIDDVLAQQAFPGREAVGQHLWIGLAPIPAASSASSATFAIGAPPPTIRVTFAPSSTTRLPRCRTIWCDAGPS